MNKPTDEDIDIETAKEAATYLKDMLNPRKFRMRREGDNEPYNGNSLTEVVGYFVFRFRQGRYTALAEQLVYQLVRRRFDLGRINEVYRERCKKWDIGYDGYGLGGGEKSEHHCEWPSGFYRGGFGDVHLLDGTDSVEIGRWIEARANVMDEAGRHVGIYVRFFADSGTWINHVIELDDLSSDGSKMFQALETAGYRISSGRKARAALRRLIQDSKNVADNEVVMRYSRPGWHGDMFVLPTGETTCGDKGFVVGGVNPEVGGTSDEWCEHVRDQIWTGDTPQFAVGMLAGLSGIISSRLACDHPVVYFTGPMGSGKTTSQIIGAGTVANPNEGCGTLFGVSDEIDIHRGLGTCLHIDDPTKRPSFASAKKIESLIYGLHERTASTVSSVSTLERLIEKAKGMMSDGIRRRVLTIDTQHIEPIEIGRAMAIKSAARRFYGHAAPIFAARVAEYGVEDLHERVRECTSAFAGKTNDPELYGIAWIAGILLSAAQIGENCEVVPEGGPEQVFPILQDAVNDWQGRRREGSGLAVIESLVSEARPLGESLEGQVWIGQDRDGDGSTRVIYVRTDRLDRGQVRQVKAAGKLLELNDNNVAHNRLPLPDGRFLRHYRVKTVPAPVAVA